MAAVSVSVSVLVSASACDRCASTGRAKNHPAWVANPDAGKSSGCSAVEHSDLRGAKDEAMGRSFYVWAPASYDKEHAYPIVLTLHGYGGNGVVFQKWFEMEKYVDESALVVYPDAAHDGVWDFKGTSDLDFLSAVLDRVASSWCVDRSRVLVFGFSFGSKMAQHVGCKRPDLVRAAAAGAGGWADQSPTCEQPIPVMVVHRTRDDNESINHARDSVKRWVQVDSCTSPTPEPSPLGLGCVRHTQCAVPGGVTFCEDTHFDPAWKPSWNHTVREEYRALVWKWFAGL